MNLPKENSNKKSRKSEMKLNIHMIFFLPKTKSLFMTHPVHQSKVKVCLSMTLFVGALKEFYRIFFHSFGCYFF